ncbi:MAG: NmrA family NAD(P)-binding protein [Bacteroidetes bacterium]|nr:NmrA family NAD(P)-binding protein [Bacteroidota bacterium]
MPTLQGKYKVPHMDAKGEADEIFKGLGLPVTLLGTSFYWENFVYFGLEPQKGPDGRLAITLPMGDKKLPGIASEDIGKCAFGIFKKGDEYIGKWIAIAGEHLTGNQIAASMSRALDQEIAYNAVEPDVFRSFGFPGAEDLGNMFQFKRDFEDYYCGVRNLDVSRSLNPDLKTFDVWLEEKKDLIPIPES